MNEPRGCLAFLFGFGGSTAPKSRPSEAMTAEDEGNVHSGPGGYEDMGYADGYAADYFADEEGEH